MKYKNSVLEKVAERTIAMNLKTSRPSRFLGDWFESWDWGPGVGVYGLLCAYRKSGDKHIFQALCDYVDNNLKRNVRKSVNSTTPCLVALELYRLTGKEKYLAIVNEYIDFMMQKCARTNDGLVVHGGVDMDCDNEVWVDTMFMAGIFLIEAGVRLSRDELIKEGIFQLTGHLKKLQDESGLFYHGFSYRKKSFIGCLWARGNAWATVSVAVAVNLLKDVPGFAEQIKEMASYIQKQCVYLRYMQDPQFGGFYTVMNDTSSYMETSATAGFAYGIKEGIRLGYLDENLFGAVAEKAEKYVLSCIDHEGGVRETSAGTGVQIDYTWYKLVRKDELMPWGQGLALMMLTFE